MRRLYCCQMMMKMMIKVGSMRRETLKKAIMFGIGDDTRRRGRGRPRARGLDINMSLEPTRNLQAPPGEFVRRMCLRFAAWCCFEVSFHGAKVNKRNECRGPACYASG